MTSMRACVRLLSAASLCAVAVVAWGHPGHGAELDAQTPWSGGGFSIDNDTPPPIAFPSNNVQLLAWLPLGTLSAGASSSNTCEGYVSGSGREYAIIGTSNSTCFVEVTNPAAPVVVANIGGPVSLWRDIQTYQTYAYAVSEGGGGIQVMDLSNIDSGVVTALPSVNTPDTASTHTVHINKASGYLYRCGGQGYTNGPGGLRIYSLANPAAPAFVAQWTPRYVHETQVVSYTSGPYAGKEIAFNFAQDTSGGVNPRMDILDVTNKAAITQLSTTGYPNAQFCHQGWLSPDRQFMYIDDELDEQNLGLGTLTRVFNVSNLSAPVYLGTFGNGGTAIDHNQYTLGNRLFQSNYRSGLRVFDTTNQTSPVEVAYFDTYPENNTANFNGLWDNYPYLPSGIVLGSDIEKGLFVWWVGPAQLSFDTTPANPNPVKPSGEKLRVNIAGVNGATIVPGTPTLRYSLAGGSGPFTALAMTETTPGVFEAQLPAVACGATVNYYFSAKANNGIQFRYPATTFTAQAAYSLGTGFADDMEANLGWVVGAAGDNATTGIWIRADPVGTAAQPENDNPDGTGTLCWITGNGAVNGGVGDADVDGGTTTLTSPSMDALAQPGDSYINYARWYSNNQGGDPNNDSMPVQISNNNGSSWTQIELVTENAGVWRTKQFRIADFVTPTSQMKVRFQARDLGTGSVVEAGVDDVRISFVQCTPPPCLGDINGDLTVNTADLTALLGQFGQNISPGTGADLNGDGTVNTADLTSLLGRFGQSC